MIACIKRSLDRVQDPITDQVKKDMPAEGEIDAEEKTCAEAQKKNAHKIRYRQSSLEKHRRHAERSGVEQTALRRRIGDGRKVQVSGIAPILAADGDGQAGQVSAPTAAGAPDIKVLEQQDKRDEGADECQTPHGPPQPPHGHAVPEVVEGMLDKGAEALVVNVRRGAIGGVDDLVGTDGALGDGFGRAQDADSQHQAHEEAANVREVVETWEETQHKRNGDIDEDEDQIPDWRGPLRPGVEQVKKSDGKDSEEASRTAARGVSTSCKVASQNEAKDPRGKVHNGKADAANKLFYVASESELEQ